MKPPKFTYIAPTSLEEVIGQLAADPDAKVISGGQSLMPLLAMRLARPSCLVDLRQVPGLDQIELVDGGVRIGARVTHSTIEHSALLAEQWPILAVAARHIAHPQIRSRGTIGGSVAHADASAEWPSVLLALGADIEVVGPQGPRTITVDDFFVGPFTSSLLDAEVVVAIRIPQSTRRWAFAEAARKSGDYGLALVAMSARIEQGRLVAPRVSVGAAVGTASRLMEVEQALDGAAVTDELPGQAAQAAIASVQPISDVHGSGDYRRNLVGALVRQAVTDMTKGE